MKSKNIICYTCNNNFLILNTRYNHQIKKGRTKFFCSGSCSSKYNSIGNTNSMKGIFSYFLKTSRNRKKEFNLDEEYLDSIWTGRCMLTNIEIHISRYNQSNKLNSASLDRIDSSKGYIKGNVQFVAYGINLAKNKFSDNELLEFIQLIKNVDKFDIDDIMDYYIPS